MKNLLSWRKTNPEPTSPEHGNKPDDPVVQVLRPPEPVEISIPDIGEPNYQNVERVVFNEQVICLTYAPVLVIGLGAFGSAVLRSLSGRIPVDDTGIRPVRLLSLGIREESEPDYSLPAFSERLRDEEILDLPASLTDVNYAWHTPSDRTWTRSAGRLAIFQRLTASPSLWDNLQPHVTRDGGQDVWIVGAAFGPTSGMLSDLAHLIQKITASNNPGNASFVGCMLALPNNQWAATHMAEAAATLRELERQLRIYTPRKYFEKISSDNKSIREHVDQRGDDDFSSLVLCEPDGELWEQEASADLIEKMATAIFVFSQKEIWEGSIQARQFLSSGKRTLPDNDERKEICVSAFGVSAYGVPLCELKQVVRSRLARAVLFDPGLGIFSPWHGGEIEISDDELRQFLMACRHPYLVLLANIKNSLDHPSQWPAATNVAIVLAENLRLKLQSDFGSDLHQSKQFCARLTEFMTDLDLGEDNETYQAVIKVVQAALSAIEEWEKQIAPLQKDVDRRIRFFEEVLAQKNRNNNIMPEKVSADLTGTIFKDRVFTDKVKEYVQLAWIRQGSSLQLTLDILSPSKWENHAYRFSPSLAITDDFWKALHTTMAVFTQEDAIWPCLLTDNRIELPDQEQAQKKAFITLGYDPGRLPAGFLQASRCIEASGDANWLKRSWFPQANAPSKMNLFSSDFGVLFQMQQAIPFSTVHLIRDLREKYLLNNSSKTSHVFIAEQLAIRLEKQAYDQLNIRQRREIQRPVRLSYSVLDWLDKDFAGVKCLVAIWVSGFVTKKKTKAVINLPGTKTILWETDYRENPWDILASFMLEEDGERERICEQWNIWKKNNSPSNIAQEEKILDWWNGDQKKLDWFILANGLIKGDH